MSKVKTKIVGLHEGNTINQFYECMKYGNAVSGVLAADGHLGYSQPVGASIAYRGQVSISGVGFDIGCGNLAVRTDASLSNLESSDISRIADDIASSISFGIGRTNATKVDHALFDRSNTLWDKADVKDLKRMAEDQLGTVGGGNHYVDVFADEKENIWIGVHFGSRGLGHKTATKYLKLAGGKDGMNVPPTLLDVNSELGIRYLAAMKLAGDYAYAGREWVVNKVASIIGCRIEDVVHNHHNYAWQEEHDGEKLWVVRKGATPAFPNQRGFVGGSMGDDAVIIRGKDSARSKELLYSTVHGAGRNFGRAECKRRFTQEEMVEWCRNIGVEVRGGDVDESPMAYRRLDSVLSYHYDTIEVETRLRPLIVVMSPKKIIDPFRD